MPQHYVLRLLFDKCHRSLLAVTGQDEVIGGITFREFAQPGFMEVAFCAVRSDYQVRGYGSALMANLKECAKRNGLYHVLTMADNNAIVFFRKQGFSTDIILTERQWKGYIKEYEGVTLMECLVHAAIDYTDGCKAVLARQRQAVRASVEELTPTIVRREGLHLWRAGPGYVDPNCIPGLDTIKWVREHHAKNLCYEKWQPKMVELLDSVRSHTDASKLLSYVDPNGQIDLPSIHRKCTTSRFYITVEMFAADMRRLFAAVRPDDEEGMNAVELAFKRDLAQALLTLRTADRPRTVDL